MKSSNELLIHVLVLSQATRTQIQMCMVPDVEVENETVLRAVWLIVEQILFIQESFLFN